jgi:chromosome segregation ATPase
MNGSDGRDTLDKIESLEKMGFRVVREPAQEKSVIDGYKSSLSQASRAVEELRELADERRDKIRILESVNKDLVQRNKQLRRDLNDVVIELESYKSQNINLDHIIEGQKEQIREKDELLAGYRHENQYWGMAVEERDQKYAGLETLYEKYRKTAHDLYGELNVIAGAVKFARENIQMAHTAEEWRDHFPDGFTWIEESAPFAEEDYDKMTEMVVEREKALVLEKAEERLRELDKEMQREIWEGTGEEDAFPGIAASVDAYVEELEQAEREAAGWDDAVEEVLNEHSDIWEALAEHDRDKFNKLVRGIISERMTEIGKEIERYEEILHGDPSDDFPSWGRLIQESVQKSDE